MKTTLSFCAIFILFQSLMFGSLVKIKLPAIYQDKWEETRINKQIVLDSFLMPGKDGFNENFQNKNERIPFHFKETFMIRSISAHPMASTILFKPYTSKNSKNIPVFILNGTLRM